MSTVTQNPISSILESTAKITNKNKGCIIQSATISGLIVTMVLLLYIIAATDPAINENDKKMTHFSVKSTDKTAPRWEKSKNSKPNQTINRKRMLRKCFSSCISDYVVIEEKADKEVNKVVTAKKQ